MAYKVIILYQLYMPSYFLGTFTEYPYLTIRRQLSDLPTSVGKRLSRRQKELASRPKSNSDALLEKFFSSAFFS